MYFRKIIGHQGELARIEEDFQKNNPAHAYFLAGPSDIGKFTVAMEMAKFLQTKDLPEGSAEAAISQIEKGYHPDVIALRKSGPEKVKVEEIRNVLTSLNLTGESNYRVLVVEDFERLTPEAANTMLKILEEPPTKVTFIFTSSKPDFVLETILSRVRRIDFKRLSDQEMREALKNRFRLESEENISRITELSAGRIGLAIRLLENAETQSAYLNVFTEIESFLREKDLVRGMGFVGQIHTDQLLTELFVRVCLIVLRKMLLEAVEERAADKQERLVKQLDFVLNLAGQLETNANSRLMLENLLLHL